MNDKYERQMKKGVLDMLVLKLLESEAKYGYQIIQEMREKSKETFLLKDGTLYPILYRLEDDGLVISRWSEAEGRQIARKYYEITDAGKIALGEIETVWKHISDGITEIMGVTYDSKSICERYCEEN
ncbi:MAG: PadR family transcriptional regulator [Lachnospiraceae bacterium]|nr:PadR family transcriptional regulator [Lachnospiraceae bacterium]